MKKTLLIPSLLLGTVLASGNILSRFPSEGSTSAANSSASMSTSVTVSNACTMTADTTSSGNSAHSANLSVGTYTTDIGRTTLNVSCNDVNGWVLYAVGAGTGSNKTDLVETANSSLIIPTGTATSGTTSNWAMKLSGTGTNTDGTTGPIISPYNNYAAVPSTNTKVASLDRNSSTSGGSSVMTTYAAYIASNQAAGSYTGSVKYTLAHPSTNLVCDDGYENVNGTCQLKTLATISTMQEMTSTICANTTTPSASDGASTPQYQLEDTRDHKLYWVAKLADGNCWMTQNLDYDIKSSDNVVALTGDGSATTWSSSYAPQVTTTGSTPYNNSDSTGTYSYDPGNYYLPSGFGPQTAITCTSSSNGGENCHYHLGNYYQWNAVTAGTGGTISDADATASICPVGWRLPTSNSYTDNYSFGKLTNAYGITSSANASSDTALLASPLWFVRAGNANSGSLYYQGSYSYVWSSRAYSSTGYAYYFFFFSSNVNPSNDYNRYGGFSARCVAI